MICLIFPGGPEEDKEAAIEAVSTADPEPLAIEYVETVSCSWNILGCQFQGTKSEAKDHEKFCKEKVLVCFQCPKGTTFLKVR